MEALEKEQYISFLFSDRWRRRRRHLAMAPKV